MKANYDSDTIWFGLIGLAIIAGLVYWCFSSGPCSGGASDPLGLSSAIDGAISDAQQVAPSGSSNPLKDGQ